MHGGRYHDGELALETGAPMAGALIRPGGTVALRWCNRAMADLLGLARPGGDLADALTESSGPRLAAVARDLLRRDADTASVHVDVPGGGRSATLQLDLVAGPRSGPGRWLVRAGLRPARRAVLHARPVAPAARAEDPSGRQRLTDRLATALARLRRRPSRVVLALVSVSRPGADGAAVTAAETAEVAARVREAARDTDTVVELASGRIAVLAEDPGDGGELAMARRILAVSHRPTGAAGRPAVTVALLEVTAAEADPEAVLDHLEGATAASAPRGGLVVLDPWTSATPGTGGRPAAEATADSGERVRRALGSGRFVLGRRPVLPLRRSGPDEATGRTTAARGRHRIRTTLIEVGTVDDGHVTPVRVTAAGLARALDSWLLGQVGASDLDPDEVPVALRLQPGGVLGAALDEEVAALLDRVPEARLVLQVPEDRLAEAVSAERAVLRRLLDRGVGLGVSGWTGRIDVATLVRWRVGLVELAPSCLPSIGRPETSALVTGLIAGLRAGLGPDVVVVAERPGDPAVGAALGACGVVWAAPQGALAEEAA